MPSISHDPQQAADAGSRYHDAAGWAAVATSSLDGRSLTGGAVGATAASHDLVEALSAFCTQAASQAAGDAAALAAFAGRLSAVTDLVDGAVASTSAAAGYT